MSALHALGPVDREGDVLVGALVHLPAVALLQELREARDLAQRLLQVVRRDVGELLEVAVGAPQLLGLLGEQLVGQLDLGARRLQDLDLVDERDAHPFDVARERRRSRPGRPSRPGAAGRPTTTARASAASASSGSRIQRRSVTHSAMPRATAASDEQRRRSPRRPASTSPSSSTASARRSRSRSM